MKKLFLIPLFLFLMISFVSAIDENDVNNRIYYDFEEQSGSQVEDITGNNNNATNSGATLNVTGIIDRAYSFDGINDLMTLSNLQAADLGSDNFSFSMWVNSSDTSHSQTLLFAGDSASYPRLTYWSAADCSEAEPCFQFYSGGGFSNRFIGAVQGQWFHVVLTRTNDNFSIYVNGTLQNSHSNSVTFADATNMIVGRWPTVGGRFYEGTLDEWSFWNKSLNSSEVAFLYNDGAPGSEQQYPFAPPAPPSINESTETVSAFIQTINVTVVGSGFQTIYSTTFPVEQNDTPFYISNAIELTKSGGSTGIAECNVLLDGSPIANRNKTIAVGEFGNMYIVTINSTIDTGNHTMGLECSRQSGGGQIIFSNGVILGHQLVTEDGSFLNHQFETFNFSSIPTNFTLLTSFNFTLTNTTLGTNQTRSAVIDWSAQYDWNTTGIISTQIRVNGTQCSNFTANGTNGLVRNLGGVCTVAGFSGGEDVLVEIFGRDSGGVAVMSMHAKEIIVDQLEMVPIIVQNVPILTSNLSFIGGGINISNVGHASIDFLTSVGFSIVSNNGNTTFSGQVEIVGPVNQTGNIIKLSVGEDGAFLVLQNLLQEFPEGQYNLRFKTACANANCTFRAIDSTSYASNVVTEIVQGFNVSVEDNWDNSTLDDFSVELSGGAIFSTTVGSLIVFSNLSSENLSFTSTFNGGYFPNSVIDHNTSTPIIHHMNQTIINFTVAEIITGTILSDTNFTINNLTLDVFNLKAGSYNVTAQKDGYFDLTDEITVVALQNGTVALSGMFNLLLNITVLNIINNTFVGTFSGNITLSPIPTFTTTFFGTNNLSQVGVLQNLSYIVQLDPIAGLAITGNSANLTSVNTTGVDSLNVSFGLFTNNSISFEIFDTATNALFNGTVNISLVGSLTTINTGTTNGTLYLDMLPDDTYTVTFTTNRTDPATLFVTVANSSHQDVTVFLDSVNTVKDFLVQDNLGVFQPNVILTFLRLVNGSFVTIGQTQTDFSGRSSIFLNGTVTYTFFATKTGFITFFGNVTPTEPEYTVIIFRDTEGIPTSIFDSLSWSTPFSYTVGSNEALAEFLINSADGSLEFFGLNATYEGINYSSVQTSSPSGGILNLNITNIDPDVEPLLTVEYFFKLVGEDVEIWNATYFLDTVNASEVSITGGLFDDLIALDRTNAIRGLVGMLIILIITIIFGKLSKDVTPTIIGALIGVGINWFYTLMPRSLLVITMVVLAVLLVADNTGGRR